MTAGMLRRGKALVVHLSGTLDAHVRVQLERALAPLAGARLAIIDLTGVKFADTTLLNAVVSLLRRRKVLFATCLPLRIAGASPIISRIFHLTRLDTLVDFYASLRDAQGEGPPVAFQLIETEAYVAGFPQSFGKASAAREPGWYVQ